MTTLGSMLLFLTLSFMIVTLPSASIPFVITAHFMSAAALQTGAKTEGLAKGIETVESSLADTTGVDGL